MISVKEQYLTKCPYCGGEPKLTKCGDQKEYFVYLCSNCNETPVRLDEARVTERGASRIWNKRVADALFYIKTYERHSKQVNI